MNTDPKLIEAFMLMWGTYPSSATLIHKSKTIVAVNEACRQGGRKPGMICAQWGPPERHKICFANETLAKQQPFYKEVRNEKGLYRAYWLPIPGYPEYYVHFTTETLPPSLLAPAKEGGDS